MLCRAQQRGWVGPGPIERHIDHALGFLAVIDEPPLAAADLGSGGGLPGLVLALALPTTRWVLIDAATARTDALQRAGRELGLEDRLTVVHGRAERLAHDGDYREQFDLVIARSFGPPAVTAEVGSGLLAHGGALIISDPPDPGRDRWPATPLAGLGLRARSVGPTEVALTVLEKSGPLAAELPRVTAALYRRPRW